MPGQSDAQALILQISADTSKALKSIDDLNRKFSGAAPEMARNARKSAQAIEDSFNGISTDKFKAMLQQTAALQDKLAAATAAKNGKEVLALNQQIALQERLNRVAAVQLETQLAVARATGDKGKAEGIQGALQVSGQFNKLGAVGVTGAKAIGEAEAFGAAISGAKNLEKEVAAVGTGFSLTRNQALELGHVLRSVFDSAASGGNPFRVIAQESGRLGEILGEGKGGIGGVLSGLGRLLAGPIGLLGVLAAVIAAVAGSAVSFVSSQRELALSLDGAGRAAGGTVQGLEQIAEASGRAGNISVGAARDIERALLATGKVHEEVFGRAIAVQRDFAAAMGLKSKQATEELAKALADPAKGADELNARLHFLSDAQAQQIRELAEAGDRTAAQKLLTDQLSGAVSGASEHLGGLANALHAVTTGFGDAWNAAGKFFARLAGAPDSVDAATAKIAQLKATGSPFFAGQIASLEKYVADAKANEQKAKTAQGNELSGLSGDAIRKLNPEIDAVRTLNAQLDLLKREQKTGWAGLKAEEAKAGARDISALTQALKTYVPERERAQKLAEIDAQLALRPGSAVRERLQAQRERVSLAGQVLTPEEVEARVAAAGEKGANRGLRTDHAAEARAEAAARQTAELDKTAADAKNANLKELASAQAALITGIHDHAEAEKAAVDDDLNKKIADLKAEEAKILADKNDAHKQEQLTALGAAEVEAKMTAELKKELIDRQAAAAVQQQVLQAREFVLGQQSRISANAAAEALTAADRNAIERASLLAEQKLARDKFDAETDTVSKGKSGDDLDNYNRNRSAEKAALLAGQQSDRGRQAFDLAGPLDQYLHKVQDLNTEFQQDGVEAIQSLSGVLAQMGQNTKQAGAILEHWLLDLAIKVAEQEFAANAAPALVSGAKGLLAFLGLAGGGPVSGPGSSTSDSIPAMLSDGEYVVKASAASRHMRLLQAINSGRPLHFAQGGPVGAAPSFPLLGMVASIRTPQLALGRGGASSHYYDLRGAWVDKDAWAEVHRISAGHAQVAQDGAVQQMVGIQRDQVLNG